MKSPANLIKQGKKGEKKLTPKQLLFCRIYVCNGYNGTQAAIEAGYSKKTAQEIAAQNLLKLIIKQRIDYVKNNIEETLNLSKQKVIKEHMKMAFSSIAQLHNTWIERKEFEQLTDDQKACIEEISTSIQKKNIGTARHPEIVDVEYIKIKLFDKQKALDSISKMMGYDAATKIEVDDHRKTVSDLFPSEEVLNQKTSDVGK